MDFASGSTYLERRFGPLVMVENSSREGRAIEVNPLLRLSESSRCDAQMGGKAGLPQVIATEIHAMELSRVIIFSKNCQKGMI